MLEAAPSPCSQPRVHAGEPIYLVRVVTEIHCFATDDVLKLTPQPASTFRFSSSLCVATFSQCHLSDDITLALQFPRLKKLALQRVIISENSLHSIIAASPVLECLLLRRFFGCRCVRINSSCLTSIGVSAAYDRTMTILGLVHFEKKMNLMNSTTFVLFSTKLCN